MMNKKFFPVILLLIAGSFFIAFQTQGLSDRDDDDRQRHARILRNVGILLTEGHYSPRKIDDEFSKAVFKKFLEDLDGDKNILLQSDLRRFNRYELGIDDELRGEPLQSFYHINEVYLKRLNEVANLYPRLLDQPFDFTIKERVELDPKKLKFPADEKAREEAWRKRVKYLALSKYVDFLEDREKNKDKKDFVHKADSTLEREARDFTRRQLSRFFTTRISRETMDENFSTFVNAITGTMDPHTTYFPPIDLRSFNETMSGRFYGIGAQLKEEDGKIKIASLVSAGPAWKSGELKENDEIIKVGQGDAEPVDVTGYSVTDAVKLIRGSHKGSEVRLTIRRMDGTTKVVSLIRDDIKLEDVFARSAIINGEHKIGYIYLPEFYADFERPGGARSAADVAREVEKLKAENVEGIILDLRGNGGGSLTDVVQMAGLFIADGPIVQVKGRGNNQHILRDRDRTVQYSGPLAVMVDETSASASEIFAAAMQDYGRGIVIGSTSTYGKGTVQRNIPLNPISENTLVSRKEEDLGTVKLTLQKFYRINGGATQRRGVTPDVIIPDRLEHLKFREKDNPLSLEWDEIGSASYRPWESTFSIDPVITSANQAVNQSTTFGKIKTHVEWLENNANRNFPLELNAYKQEQKALKAVYKEIEELYKLPTPMAVQNIAADTAYINSATDKAEKNTAWLKRVKEDIYIDAGVKVVSKLIHQENLARVMQEK